VVLKVLVRLLAQSPQVSFMFGQEAIVWCRYSLMLPCASSIESCPTVELHVDELASV